MTPMLSTIASRTKPLGGSARLGIVRGGREQTVTVALQIAPEMPREEIVIRSRSPFSGVKIANLSPALVDELQLQNVDQGVVDRRRGYRFLCQQSRLPAWRRD